MLHCHHCQFLIVDPDLPRDLKIRPGMLCPVCFTDMSLPPRVRVTGAQVFAKYVVSILSGGTFGLLAMALVAGLLDGSPSILALPGPILIFPVILLMFAIGSKLDGMLERTRRHAVRWLILAAPLLAAFAVWLLIYTFTR